MWISAAVEKVVENKSVKCNRQIITYFLRPDIVRLFIVFDHFGGVAQF